jgi:hypothetical protein
MGPSHSYHLQVPTSTGKVHPPSNPMVGLDPHLTHKLEEFDVRRFDTEHPFSFLHACPPESQIPELPKEPKISPRGSSLRAFQLTLDTASQTSRVPKSQTPEGSTLTRGDILDMEARTGGSRILLPPNGPKGKCQG